MNDSGSNLCFWMQLRVTLAYFYSGELNRGLFILCKCNPGLFILCNCNPGLFILCKCNPGLFVLCKCNPGLFILCKRSFATLHNISYRTLFIQGKAGHKARLSLFRHLGKLHHSVVLEVRGIRSHCHCLFKIIQALCILAPCKAYP